MPAPAAAAAAASAAGSLISATTDSVVRSVAATEAAFKRAVGHMLKEKLIVIKEDGIYERDKH